MENIAQRVCAWSGPLFVFIFLACLIIMDFLPPPSPAMDAAQIADMYEQNRLGIRFGGTIILQACILMILCVIAIAFQLRRIEDSPIFSTILLISGVCANFLFVFVATAWTMAAFRPDRAIEDIQAWNDLGWMFLLMQVTTLSMQGIAIGLAILLNTKKQTLFPRWVGYYNLWFAILFLPGALITFFKTGPFAWNGILVFWLALGLFTSWIFIMAWSTDRAIRTPNAVSAP